MLHLFYYTNSRAQVQRKIKLEYLKAHVISISEIRIHEVTRYEMYMKKYGVLSFIKYSWYHKFYVIIYRQLPILRINRSPYICRIIELSVVDERFFRIIMLEKLFLSFPFSFSVP